MNHARNREGERGAAMVEFAIILPLLLTLIFGMIEFGVCLYDKAMITNASREAARAGIVFGRAGMDVNLIETVASNYSAANLITFSQSGSTLAVTTESSTTPGDTPAPANFQNIPSGEYLWVTVIYPYEFLLIPNLITNITGTVNLTAVTCMRVE